MKTRTPIRSLRVVETRRTYLLHFLAVMLLWAIAMTMDYHEQAAQATENLAACMNGKLTFTAPSGEQVGCMPAETIKPTERNRT